MSMREKIADVLARVPVRDGVHPGGELDKARRFDAADAILNILNEYGEEEIEAVRDGITPEILRREDGRDTFELADAVSRAAIKAFLGTLP